MLDVLQTKLDMSRLNSRIQTWAKAVGLSLAEALQKQAGLLKQELMTGAPPMNLAKSKKQAAKDVKKRFFPKPLDTFKGLKAQGKGMIWLYAGKKNGRFLAGVEPQDFQPAATDEQMQKLHYTAFRGAAWHHLGDRGGMPAEKRNASTLAGYPFKVMRINRTVVGRGRFRAFTKKVQDNFGKLKAAWVVGMDRFKSGRTVSAWVLKHVRSGKAKGFNVINLKGPKPFVQIINRAAGVEHKESIRNVRRAVKKRLGAMLADMRLHLNGTKKKAGFKAA